MIIVKLSLIVQIYYNQVLQLQMDVLFKTFLKKIDKFKDTKEFEMLAGTKMIKERLGMTHDNIVEFKTGRTGQCNYFFVLIH